MFILAKDNYNQNNELRDNNDFHYKILQEENIITPELIDFYHDTSTNLNYTHFHLTYGDMSKEYIKQRTLHIMKDTESMCMLFYKRNQLIGDVSFWKSTEDNARWISYNIIEAQRGKGYGKKITKMAMDIIKTKKPHICELYAIVFVHNIPSQKLLERLEFITVPISPKLLLTKSNNKHIEKVRNKIRNMKNIQLVSINEVTFRSEEIYVYKKNI